MEDEQLRRREQALAGIERIHGPEARAEFEDARAKPLKTLWLMIKWKRKSRNA